MLTISMKRFSRVLRNIIEGTAAACFDCAADAGLAGPIVGRAPGHAVLARPRGDGLALRNPGGEVDFLSFGEFLGHRRGDLGLLGIGQVFGHHTHHHGRQPAASRPFCPTRGSQPGAQAGRRALEG